MQQLTAGDLRYTDDPDTRCIKMPFQVGKNVVTITLPYAAIALIYARVLARDAQGEIIRRMREAAAKLPFSDCARDALTKEMTVASPLGGPSAPVPPPARRPAYDANGHVVSDPSQNGTHPEPQDPQ